MRNDLPRNGPRKNEAAIVNLDNKNNRGTHWVAYRKIGDRVVYFDSFGNLQPPRELMTYFGVGSVIKYNRNQYQEYNEVICGHLCLNFLLNKSIYKV